MAPSSDFKALYAANSQEGTVSRLDLGSSDVQEVPIGKEPSRITRAGDRLFVTLRGERKIAVLSDDGGSVAVAETIAVGAEPFGIVASEDGSRVYAAISMSDEVIEIDADTLDVLRTWSVGGEPRWVALHPSGDSLYVASVFGGQLTRIDLGGDGRATAVELPKIQTFSGIDGSRVTFVTRLTGDPTFTPSGDKLIQPAFMLDTATPIPDDPSQDHGQIRPTGGYDSAGRLNSVAILVPVDGSGEPAPVDDIEVVPLNTFVFESNVNSYPTSVTVSPDGEIAMVSMEGSGSVVAFAIHQQQGSRDLFDVFSDSRPDFAEPGFGSFSFRPVVGVRTAAGPMGVTFVDAGIAHSYAFLDRKVERIDVAQLAPQLGVGDTSGKEIALFGPTDATAGVDIARPTLTHELEQGRRLFFAANDARMSAVGSGVSCATCHFQGRVDGITWQFNRGPRQTPSLAGKVSETAPVRWEGDRASIAEDAMMTSQGLMGGQGLTHEDTLLIEAFVDSARHVDLPLKGSTDARIARGKAIFERSDVACGSCHSGARHSDGKIYKMLGMDVKTRSLTGIAATAPYFHDGSAATLRDVLEKSASIGMGSASHLTGAEKDDLEAYLRSL